MNDLEAGISREIARQQLLSQSVPGDKLNELLPAAAAIVASGYAVKVLTYINSRKQSWINLCKAYGLHSEELFSLYNDSNRDELLDKALKSAQGKDKKDFDLLGINGEELYQESIDSHYKRADLPDGPVYILRIGNKLEPVEGSDEIDSSSSALDKEGYGGISMNDMQLDSEIGSSAIKFDIKDFDSTLFDDFHLEIISLKHIETKVLLVLI